MHIVNNEEMDIIKQLSDENGLLKSTIQNLEKQIQEQQLFYADLCDNQPLCRRIRLWIRYKILKLIRKDY